MPVNEQRQNTSEGSHQHVYQVQQRPLEGAESAVNDHEDEEDRDGNDQHEPRCGSLLALVFALPVDVVAGRQLDLCIDLLDRLFDGATKVAAANAVLDGDIALVAFAVNFGGAIALFDLAKLRQRDAFTARREQADVFNRFFLVPELLLIAQHQVIARLALQDLREGVAAHRGLDRILHVGDVDLVAGGLLAIHGDVQVRLAEHAKDPQVLDALNLAHGPGDFSGFIFEGFQVVAIYLCCKLALSRR